MVENVRAATPIAVRLVVVACSLLVALGAFEAGVRLFSPAPPLMYLPDPTLGWVHPRDATFDYTGNSGQIEVHFNSKGLRGPEYPYEKPAGTYRILVLGDSYAEAADVHALDIFTTRLEASFRASGCPLEVINSGVGGYGTDQQALFLQQEGWRYSPDLVLLTFTIDNDVHDNLTKGYCRMTVGGVECDPPGRVGPAREFVVSAKAFLQQHFHTYFFVRERTARLYPVRLLLQQFGLSEFNDAAELRRQVPMPISLFLRQEPADVAEGWRLTQGILLSIAHESRRRGVDFAVALIPSGLQLDDPGYQEAIKATGLPAAAFDRARPNRVMSDFGAANAIPIVDLLDRFRSGQARGEQLVDGHWNSRGHAAAADVIHRELTHGTGRMGRC